MSGDPERAVTRWWLLRHAPVPSPAGRINGRLDLPCDTTAEEVFRLLSRRLPPRPVLVESGLLRCRQTAGALEIAGMALAPPQVEPDLAEQDFGRWQGRTWGELEAAGETGLPAFWADPANTAPPGGESFAAVIHRVSAVVERLTRQHRGKDILAVVHAGTIRAALAVVLELPASMALRFSIQPLSVTRVDATNGEWRVECIGESPQSYLPQMG